jgi:hypothetical protein
VGLLQFAAVGQPGFHGLHGSPRGQATDTTDATNLDFASV